MKRPRSLVSWLQGSRRVQHVYQPELVGKLVRVAFRGNLVLYLVGWDNGRTQWCRRSELAAENAIQQELTLTGSVQHAVS